MPPAHKSTFYTWYCIINTKPLATRMQIGGTSVSSSIYCNLCERSIVKFYFAKVVPFRTPIALMLANSKNPSSLPDNLPSVVFLASLLFEFLSCSLSTGAVLSWLLGYSTSCFLEPSMANSSSPNRLSKWILSIHFSGKESGNRSFTLDIWPSQLPDLIHYPDMHPIASNPIWGWV